MDVTTGQDGGREFRSAMTPRDLAVGVGSTLALYLSGFWMPLMGIFLTVITPLPTLVGVYRWGRPAGYLIPAAAALIGFTVLLVLGFPRACVYLGELLLLGVFLAGGMRRERNVGRIVGEASLKIFAVGAVVFWLMHLRGGASFGDLLEQKLIPAIREILEELDAGAGVSREELVSVIATLVAMLPGTVFAATVMISWFNLLLARRFCRTRGVALPAWKPWSQWKSPEVLVWAVIGSGFALMLPSSTGRIWAANLLIALGAVYLLHGFAVVVFYCDRWRVPALLRGIVYAVVFLQQVVSLAVVLLGLFDTWFDFRRLSGPKASEGA